MPLLPDDAPLLSPRRLLNALRLWVWFIAVAELPVYIPCWYMLRFHRRPAARDRYDTTHPHSRKEQTATTTIT